MSTKYEPQLKHIGFDWYGATGGNVSGTANQVLRLNGAGTSCGFGAIDLSQSASVDSRGGLIIGCGWNGWYFRASGWRERRGFL
jgi:hypothetical protein